MRTFVGYDALVVILFCHKIMATLIETNHITHAEKNNTTTASDYIHYITKPSDNGTAPTPTESYEVWVSNLAHKIVRPILVTFGTIGKISIFILPIFRKDLLY